MYQVLHHDVIVIRSISTRTAEKGPGRSSVPQVTRSADVIEDDYGNQDIRNIERHAGETLA